MRDSTAKHLHPERCDVVGAFYKKSRFLVTSRDWQEACRACGACHQAIEAMPHSEMHRLVHGDLPMKFHPIADLFPLLTDAELESLAANIKEKGLLAPITLFEKKILDGRNRYLACRKAKVEPRFREHRGDPLAFVISANLHRRHLNESQRALVAAKIATLPPGKQSLNPPKGGFKTDEAAKQLNVGKRNVERARAVLQGGTKSQINRIQDGTKTVREVEREIKEKSKSEQKIVDDTGYPVPSRAMEFWNRKDEAKALLSIISKARCSIRDLTRDDPMWHEVNLNSVLSSLDNAYNAFAVAVPYAICPTCQGQAAKSCTLCKGRAVISRFRFDNTVPKELKDIRAKACAK